jgi:hypothetical protein
VVELDRLLPANPRGKPILKRDGNDVPVSAEVLHVKRQKLADPISAVSNIFVFRAVCLNKPQQDIGVHEVRGRAVESHISRKTSEMPGFPVRGTKQQPRVRLSLRKAA